MDEREPDAVIAVSDGRCEWAVHVHGERVNVAGVDVVIDEDFSGDELATLRAALETQLRDVHPRLRAPIREIIVPDLQDPSGQAGAASGNQSTGQICLWSNRYKLGLPEMLPATATRLLEHECAHLLFPLGGPPDISEWVDAIDRDGPSVSGRYVDADIEACYDESKHVTEDWANSVAFLRQDDRDKQADSLTTWFRWTFPHRTAIIDRVLSIGETAPEE